MPVPQELHHSSSARFQSGNRVYRVVILGQGGVGKSGKPFLFSSYKLLGCMYTKLCLRLQLEKFASNT